MLWALAKIGVVETWPVVSRGEVAFLRTVNQMIEQVRVGHAA
jgi:hypothetical protein